MCSFLVANWIIGNLAYANFFLQPRGPDETNRWHGYGFDFVHNLLHMTGEKVLQPFVDPQRQLVALFNGEIYNWRELGSSETVFRSDGDALLSEYKSHGNDFVKRLDGEFALALFDFQRQQLVLARDPFGTKPLWYAMGQSDAPGAFAFSSYASPLRRLGFEEIHRVEPNSVLVFQVPAVSEQPPATPPMDGAPSVIHQAAVFEFDLRQHKGHTEDWQNALMKAIQKRTASPHFAPGRGTPAMCLSDGYDSGAIALSLGRLGIQPAMYTVQAREDVRVLLARLNEMKQRGMNATWKLTHLSSDQFQSEKKFLRDHAEKVFYELRQGYANVDDKAAAGLSWIYRQAKTAGQRMFLSGSGADEIVSDYGSNGVPFEFHSTLMGVFPSELAVVFPWLNFFRGTQQDYLAKEESTAGAHGVETRYPFLDRSLVQEFLWLSAETKNSLYKAPIHDFLTKEHFPFVQGTKRGFSADRNLVGEEDLDSDAAAVAARKALWQLAPAASGTVVLSSCSHPCDDAMQRHSQVTVVHRPLEELAAVMEDHGHYEEVLQTLPAWRRAAAAYDLPSSLRAPLSLAAASGVEPNHRIAILTSCMEDHYFWTYCGPLLSSIEEALGAQMVRAVVATAGLSDATLEAASAALPWVEFAPFQEHEEKLSSHEDPTAGENYRRLIYQSLKLQQYVSLWQRRILPDREVAFVICMDSDMLLVKPFMHILEFLQQLQVDIAFSYYDGTRRVPWGTPEELAFTKGKAYVRLQGGLLIMRNSVDAIQWFASWKSLTEVLLFHKDYDDRHGQRWRDLLEEFKGPSQAALAFLLTQGEMHIMKNVTACCESRRIIELEALREGDAPFQVAMMGLPTQYLNDAESTEDGLLPQTAHIIHLKGAWWRNVLPEGWTDIQTPTRSYDWNREAYDLWHRHYVKYLTMVQQSGFQLPT